MNQERPPPYSDVTGVPEYSQPEQQQDEPHVKQKTVPQEATVGTGIYPNVAYPGSVPPNAYPAGPPAVSSQVIVPGVPAVPLGPSSTTVTCPSCHHQIQSSVRSTPSTKTHLIALLMCAIGCWPCCLIPYCSDDCQNRDHNCPNCGAYLGTYSN